MDPFDPKESTKESFKLMCLLPVNYGLLKHPLSTLLKLVLYGTRPLFSITSGPWSSCSFFGFFLFFFALLNSLFYDE
ncbi:hypothetical protein N7453_003587 [Penicillium expansum]|nr:hypothetical protein N7453_003587 [Penicillium expansum]